MKELDQQHTWTWSETCTKFAIQRWTVRVIVFGVEVTYHAIAHSENTMVQLSAAALLHHTTAVELQP